MFGLTFCKISLFVFLSVHEFSAIPIVQKHQVFFYPSSSWKIPYVTIGKTKVFAIFILVFLVTFLSLRILSKFDIADFSFMILLWISFVHLPSLVTVEPKKVKHSTNSSSCPSILIMWRFPVVLLVTVLYMGRTFNCVAHMITVTCFLVMYADLVHM